MSFLLELALCPRPRVPWRLPAASVGVHIGILMVAYGLELALFRRPVFAMLNVLAIQAVLVLVSQAKYGALREPFVYPDFEYFLDAIKHPRLYLPFFGRLKALAASGGYGVMLWAGLTVEDSLTGAAGMWVASFADWIEEDAVSGPAALASFWSLTLSMVIVGARLVMWAGRDRASTRVSFDAGADLERLGFFTALWRYRAHERRTVRIQDLPDSGFLAFTPAAVSSTPLSNMTVVHGSSASLPNRVAARSGPASLFEMAVVQSRSAPPPDIVVVQSESFFDARHKFPFIRPEVLAQFDALRADADAFGTLDVAAWGANTVRTEFAFLSGMRPEALGVHKFNPYRKLAQQGVTTLASHLKGLGYRTVCVHPYPASFYRREHVYPVMGFDDFFDIASFKDAPRFGPYVSDAAVADHVSRLIADRGDDARPLFVFVITMENHGPLHWETVDAGDEQRYFDVEKGRLPSSCGDLVAYVRHLANADAMFGRLAGALSGSSRPSTLCIYGDHVPIMPAVYSEMGAPDGKTDYLIWRPPHVRTATVPEQERLAHIRAASSPHQERAAHVRAASSQDQERPSHVGAAALQDQGRPAHVGAAALLEQEKPAHVPASSPEKSRPVLPAHRQVSDLARLVLDQSRVT